MKLIEKFGLSIWYGDDIVPHTAVFVGRPTTLCNPFESWEGSEEARQASIKKFREYSKVNLAIAHVAVKQLKGRDLTCNCGTCPEHAEILMELANA